MERIFLRWASKSFATEKAMMRFVNEELIPEEEATVQFVYATKESKPYRVRFRVAYERPL